MVNLKAMKRVHSIAILAGLILLLGCNTPSPIDEDVLSRKAYDSIEEFLAKDMYDPASLEVQFSTYPTQLDTIKNPDLFPGKREGYAVVARYSSNNAKDGYFLKQQVFYVTPEGDYYHHQDLEKLSEKEKSWLWENYDTTIPGFIGSRVEIPW